MFTFLHVHRNIGRWFFPLILSITVSATIIMGIGITRPHPAEAASASDRGPSAAADAFNNQYVFWKGLDSNLWEAYYNSYTGSWNGPIKIGMGPLGSEPSVVVGDQNFTGPGGKLFQAQYVYWEGANGYLWMAYWNGSWHGPISLKVAGGPMCSQPTAAYFRGSPPGSGDRIYVFWKGLGVNGSCGSDVYSNSLWYTFSTSFPPYSNADYSGPNYDTHAGVIGSSPSAATITAGCAAPCDAWIAIAWQGTNRYLWEELFDPVSGNVTGPVSDAKALTLGSPPSISGTPLASSDPLGVWTAVWQGSDSNHRLWTVGQFANPLNVDFSPQQISNSGTLGSAPTITEAQIVVQNKLVLNTYVFWKGTDGHLWEAYENGDPGPISIIGLGAYSGTLG